MEEREKSSRRRRRRKKGRSKTPMTESEARLQDAKRRGRAKAKVLENIVQLLIVCAIVSLFNVKIAGWILLIGGFINAGELVKKFVEPELRKRWIDREVRRELDHEVAVDRKRTRGEHARHIEHLAAGVAHEIRNPITAAKSLVQQMGEDPGSTENVEFAEVALEELGRVERSISHLLRFAREEGLRAEPIDLSVVIQSALDTFQDRIQREGVEVRLRSQGAGRLEGDAEKLRRVVINLIGNGLDAMADADVAHPILEIDSGDNLAGTAVWLIVRDHGPGIGRKQLDEIWSPFFTSKDEGTGLGLALTKKIVEAHGGAIEAEPAPGGGASFLLTLPKHLPESEALS